jgi:hypothetical protein
VAPLAQGLAKEWSELAFPIPHRFTRKDEAPLEKHLRQVPQAQFVAEAPQHNQAHHIGEILQLIIERSHPFVKPTLLG